MNNTIMRRIAATAKEGELRGTDGAVLCDDDTDKIGYLRVYEFESDEFKEKLSEMLTEMGNEYLFVVNKKDNNLHMWSVPRSELVQYLPFKA